MGCVISRSCDPNAATCARAAPFPESTLIAASLASAKRVPARMLKELSTTSSTSRLLASAAALRLMNGLAKARINSSQQQQPQRQQQEMIEPAMAGRA